MGNANKNWQFCPSSEAQKMTVFTLHAAATCWRNTARKAIAAARKEQRGRNSAQSSHNADVTTSNTSGIAGIAPRWCTKQDQQKSFAVSKSPMKGLDSFVLA